MGQEDLAAAAGLRGQSISKMERGVLGASAESLFRIAQALRVDPCWLYGIECTHAGSAPSAASGPATATEAAEDRSHWLRHLLELAGFDGDMRRQAALAMERDLPPMRELTPWIARAYIDLLKSDPSALPQSAATDRR